MRRGVSWSSLVTRRWAWPIAALLAACFLSSAAAAQQRSALSQIELQANELVNQGRYAEAEQLYRRMLAIAKRDYPDEPATAGAALSDLAGLYSTMGRATEAESMAREALHIVEKTTPGDWGRYHLQSLLGAILTAEKRYADAEPLLVSGYDGLVQRIATIPNPDKPDVADAGRWIVELYEAWGMPEKVRSWEAKVGGVKPVAIEAARK